MTSIFKDERENLSQYEQPSSNLIEFVAYEDLQLQAITLEDLFESTLPKESALILEKDNSAQDTSMANLEEVLLDMSEAPPDEGDALEKQGFQAPKNVSHQPYSLHYAAKHGDVTEIETLIKAGFDVNKEDSLSSRPLYVAAMYGQDNAVKALLKHGADIHDISYTGETALHIALHKHHFEVARTLILEGKADPNKLNSKGKSAINLICNMMSEVFNHKTKDSEAFQREANELIKTLDIASSHCGKNCLYLVPTGFMENFAIPMSMQLRVFASKCPSADLRKDLLKLAEKISSFDSTEERFILAKNFLNAFPTGGVYGLRVHNGPNGLILIKADGHSELMATHWIKDSIGKFLESLKTSSSDLQKISVFEKLYATYVSADHFLSNVEDFQAAHQLVEQFHRGETVLLPSGWEGHFVTVFLSKKQELLGIGNHGDRFEDNLPGIALHHMNNPNKFDEKFMHDTVVNEKQMSLEHDALYEYEVLDKIDQIKKPDQGHGNCTRESHLDAIEGILYVELLNIGLNDKEAKKFAAEYSQQWEHFDSQFILDHFLSHQSGLSVKALMDVFVELHQKALHSQTPKFELAQASEIAKKLASEHYAPEFKYWLKQVDPENIKGLSTIYQKHNVDIKAIMADSVPESGFFDFFSKALAKVGLFSSVEKSNSLNDSTENLTSETSLKLQPMDSAEHSSIDASTYQSSVPLLNISHQIIEPIVIHE